MRGTKTWSLHLLAGLCLVILFGTHMIYTHLDLILGWFNPAGGEGTDWANVIWRGKHTITLFYYILFLGVALYHSLYGLRTIIFELGVKQKNEKIITTAFVALGVVIFIIGTVVVVVFRSIAMEA